MLLRLRKMLFEIRAIFTLWRSELFDPKYYLAQNPDVVKAGVNPYIHFLRFGAFEGRCPSKGFNPSRYLTMNPDVAQAGINPLVHYLWVGKKEGRQLVGLTARLSKGTRTTKADSWLVLDFAWGGGTALYMSASLIPTVPRSAVLFHVKYYSTKQFAEVLVSRGGQITEVGSYSQTGELFHDLDEIAFAKTVINSLVSWPSAAEALNFVAELKRKNPSMLVEYKLHDFYAVCPSYTLIDASRHFCAIRGDEQGCKACLRECDPSYCFVCEDNKPDFSVTGWRAMWESFFLHTADFVDVFSKSSRELLLKAYPGVEPHIRLVPHRIPSFRCLRVAVIGNISIQKGADVLRKLCEYLDQNGLEDMQIFLFGSNSCNLASPHLKHMGEYNRGDLPELLKKNRIDLVFIPSVCPETFCFTAGESLSLGYPTACFDMGGQADQVRGSDRGIILYNQDPASIHDTLIQLLESEPEKNASDDNNRAQRAEKNTVVLQDRRSQEFLKYLFTQRDDRSHFIPETADCITMKNTMPKVIAFYLPQFHDFPENVRWFGRGFTEWTNTSQTMPQFVGHHQPQVPIDVGYYNLDTVSAMRRQAELAKKYGISGFSVYYYWFSGKKLMEQPMRRLLEDKSIDFPFFFFWANEHWTRLWGNGADREVLYKMELLPGDAERFMEDALPYMKDPRYIKINNKPMLIIYRLKIFPKKDYLRFVTRIREIAQENGFDGLYISGILEDWMDTDKLEEAQEEYQLDALTEFSSVMCRTGLELKKQEFMDPNCRSYCYDVDDYVQNRKYLRQTKANVFAGLFTNWDNTPRRYNRGATILQNSPENYKAWLTDLLRWTRDHHKPEEQFVFVNAWNEWAEGAHLEPDTRNGYAFLHYTREALEQDAALARDLSSVQVE